MKKYICLVLAALLLVVSSAYADYEVSSGLKDNELFLMSDYVLLPIGTTREEVEEVFRQFQNENENGDFEFTTGQEYDDDGDAYYWVEFIRDNYEHTIANYHFYDDPAKGIGGISVNGIVTNTDEFTFDSLKERIFAVYGITEDDRAPEIEATELLYEARNITFEDDYAVLTDLEFNINKDKYSWYYADELSYYLMPYENKVGEKFFEYSIFEDSYFD